MRIKGKIKINGTIPMIVCLVLVLFGFSGCGHGNDSNPGGNSGGGAGTSPVISSFTATPSSIKSGDTSRLA